MRQVSVRSRGSSSTSASDPREKMKDCCRKLVAFMCTQVGVGGLVVGYAIVGAFCFQWLEATIENPLWRQRDLVIQMRANCAAELWELISHENIFDKATLFREIDEVLVRFQGDVVKVIKTGYTTLTPTDMWSYPAALMFCLSIFTMIGYGNLVPRTPWGKGVTVMYAVVGIPLYVLYFMNMGEVLATTFRWLYCRLYECAQEKKPSEDVDDDSNLPPQPAQRIIVPSTACLWVIGGYILTGTIMFAEWEGWNYLNSSYFCVTSLCKIGIGDFVPGANISDAKSGSQTKLIINFIYLLVGMGLVAMCYNLMREEIKVKMQELKLEMRQCLEEFRTRSSICYHGKRV